SGYRKHRTMRTIHIVNKSRKLRRKSRRKHRNEGGKTMNVGFIGTGSMGSILIESLLKTNALQPHQIIATNRTFAKAELLAEAHPGLKAVRTNREVALAADMMFLC